MKRIMILLKDQKNAALVRDRLEKHYQVLVAEIDQTIDFAFDLGIVDEPVLQQFSEQIQARKEADRPVSLPFLLITGRGHADFLQRHLWQSVDEVLWTPINSLELQTRVENLLRMRRMSLLNQQLTLTDSLTGLHNRRHFLELGERELNRARRFRRPLAVVMSEIDHFQRICDSCGYGIGNQILRILAACFQKNLRTIDVLGRYSEEKFAIIMTDTDRASAVKAAVRLRQEALGHPLQTETGPVACTISIGISSVSEEIPALDALIERADNALCAAKQAGRDQIMVEGMQASGADFAKAVEA